jgi:hypothetical protein
MDRDNRHLEAAGPAASSVVEVPHPTLVKSMPSSKTRRLMYVITLVHASWIVYVTEKLAARSAKQ